eukprot:scaffold115_cov241-Pinguiococcus_pyrenoidosus.AAC.3
MTSDSLRRLSNRSAKPSSEKVASVPSSWGTCASSSAISRSLFASSAESSRFRAHPEAAHQAICFCLPLHKLLLQRLQVLRAQRHRPFDVLVQLLQLGPELCRRAVKTCRTVTMLAFQVCTSRLGRAEPLLQLLCAKPELLQTEKDGRLS